MLIAWSFFVWCFPPQITVNAQQRGRIAAEKISEEAFWTFDQPDGGSKCIHFRQRKVPAFVQAPSACLMGVWNVYDLWPSLPRSIRARLQTNDTAYLCSKSLL